jgi:hypothetical protein
MFFRIWYERQWHDPNNDVIFYVTEGTGGATDNDRPNIYVLIPILWKQTVEPGKIIPKVLLLYYPTFSV